MYLCADLCINDTSTCGVKKVGSYGAGATDPLQEYELLTAEPPPQSSFRFQ